MNGKNVTVQKKDVKVFDEILLEKDLIVVSCIEFGGKVTLTIVFGYKVCIEERVAINLRYT